MPESVDENVDDPIYGPGPAGRMLDKHTCEFGPVFKCTNCPRTSRIVSWKFDHYFTKRTITCVGCGFTVDLFDRILATMSEDGPRRIHTVGGRWTVADRELQPSQILKLNKEDVGLPANALVFDKYYTNNFGSSLHDTVIAKINSGELAMNEAGAELFADGPPMQIYEIQDLPKNVRGSQIDGPLAMRAVAVVC